MVERDAHAYDYEKQGSERANAHQVAAAYPGPDDGRLLAVGCKRDVGGPSGWESECRAPRAPGLGWQLAYDRWHVLHELIAARAPPVSGGGRSS
jgi:hypothetical protein